MTAASSSVRTAAAVVAIVIACSALTAAGVPSLPVILVGAVVIAGVVARRMSARRTSGALGREPEVAGYPVCLPCERVAVGAKLQFRLLPPTRAVWAPGLLCFDEGAARFVAAAEKHIGRDWSGDVAEASVEALAGRSSSVHIRSTSGSAQFVVQQPADAVRAAVTRYVRVTT